MRFSVRSRHEIWKGRQGPEGQGSGVSRQRSVSREQRSEQSIRGLRAQKRKSTAFEERLARRDLRREAEGRQQAEEYKARGGLDENEKPLLSETFDFNRNFLTLSSI